jgi:DNA-binding HxlR family transcriptional regulator
MNPGLPQGFVRFGSIAHRILIALHELGDMRHRDLVDEMPDLSVSCIGMSLHRLMQAGLIHRVGVAAAYDTGEKTGSIYSLRPPTRHIRRHRATAAERTARYRAAQRLRQATSVFAWRPQ